MATNSTTESCKATLFAAYQTVDGGRVEIRFQVEKTDLDKDQQAQAISDYNTAFRKVQFIAFNLERQVWEQGNQVAAELTEKLVAANEQLKQALFDLKEFESDLRLAADVANFAVELFTSGIFPIPIEIQ